MTDYHWVYLLDEQFRVNRLSEQKNVSPHMVPPDRTVLCIELSLWKDEPLWQASDEEIYRLALRDLMKMGYDVTEAEVEEYHVTDIPTAYPVYELNFEDHLIPVLDGVHEVRNLMTLGRHGLFLNNSMDDNVLLGIQVADHIDSERRRQPGVEDGDARVHEPAVPGQVMRAATADGGEREHERLDRQRLACLAQQRQVHARHVDSGSASTPLRRQLPRRSTDQRRPAATASTSTCASQIARIDERRRALMSAVADRECRPPTA